MKNLQLLALALLFAIAGTEFTEARGVCRKGREWRKGKCRRKKRRRATPVATTQTPNAAPVAVALLQNKDTTPQDLETTQDTAPQTNNLIHKKLEKITLQNKAQIEENSQSIRTLSNRVSALDRGVVGPVRPLPVDEAIIYPGGSPNLRTVERPLPNTGELTSRGNMRPAVMPNEELLPQ